MRQPSFVLQTVKKAKVQFPVVLVGCYNPFNGAIAIFVAALK